MEYGINSNNFLRASRGFFQFRLFGYGFYIKNHTLPGLSMLFSQRNRLKGKIVGDYYIQLYRP